MYCTKCGTSANNKRFCTQCGIELKKSAPQAGAAESILNKQTLKEVLQDQPVDLSVRRTIDQRYFLDPRIGGGGMGDVHHAKRSHIGDVEQSSEMSSIEAPRTTRKGNALILLTVISILLLTVAAGYRNLRYINQARNIQQSTAPV